MLDWNKYTKVANRFQYKAMPQDREDLNHNIIVALADAQTKLDNNGSGQLSDVAMLRVASYERQKYWRAIKRNARYVSLNTIIEDGDGDIVELIDTIADDKAIDLNQWLEAKYWLYSFPRRLVIIASKKVAGLPLTDRDRNYLYHQRKKTQKRLAFI
jgi:hypothetical protein